MMDSQEPCQYSCYDLIHCLKKSVDLPGGGGGGGGKKQPVCMYVRPADQISMGQSNREFASLELSWG